MSYPNKTGAHKGNRPGVGTQAPAPSHGVTPRSTWQGQREPPPGSPQRPGGTGHSWELAWHLRHALGRDFSTCVSHPGRITGNPGSAANPVSGHGVSPELWTSRPPGPEPVVMLRLIIPQGQNIGTPESSLGNKKGSEAEASSRRGQGSGDGAGTEPSGQLGEPRPSATCLAPCPGPVTGARGQATAWPGAPASHLAPY